MNLYSALYNCVQKSSNALVALPTFVFFKEWLMSLTVPHSPMPADAHACRPVIQICKGPPIVALPGENEIHEQSGLTVEHIF